MTKKEKLLDCSVNISGYLRTMLLMAVEGSEARKKDKLRVNALLRIELKNIAQLNDLDYWMKDQAENFEDQAERMMFGLKNVISLIRDLGLLVYHINEDSYSLKWRELIEKMMIKSLSFEKSLNELVE